MADGGITSWIAGHANVLNNIAGSLIPVQRLITGTAYLLGLAFAFKAIFSLKTLGESRTMMSSSGNVKEPIIYLLVSGALLYLPSAVGVILQTTFGSSSILQYAPVDSSNSAIDTLFGTGSPVGPALSIIIQTIGVIAFVRGWVLIARSASQGQQPGGMGKGLVHVFGGILAMNIVATLEIINNTLYGAN